MKKILMLFFTFLSFNFVCLKNISFAESFSNQAYIDFSSDRSTWFFRISKEESNIVFSDFFSPFDPTVKLEYFDPLVMYKLENSYYFNQSNDLMINLEDLKKLYAPYFDYKIKGSSLIINFTKYDKTIISGFGERSTRLEYRKKNWVLNIDLDKKIGKYDYTEYKPVIGGRNKPFVETDEVEFAKNGTEFSLRSEEIESRGQKHYVSMISVMEILGMQAVKENGYIAVQFKNMADVTAAAERDSDPRAVRVPKASNSWRSGKAEQFDPDYTWADYMNDTADGKRRYGWQWRSFYIPSGEHFRDADGNKITLEAGRIIPVALYIPQNYDKNNTRLSFVLHGGTGNENAPMYRTMERNNNLDELAEKYNYILVSPNGWTQNPMWMHRQALYAFEKSFEMVMKEYPVNRDRLFIMGNSLGGRGVFDIVMRHPDLFKAMVSTAPAWGVKAHSQWKQSEYTLESIKNIPALIGVGTADSTFSFRTEVGNSEEPGWLTKDVVPVLNNARYVAVEEGNHSHSWGSILEMTFEFFEENINPASPLEYDIDNLEFKDVSMISLTDLKKHLGSSLQIFPISSYNKNPEDAVNYFTVIYGKQAVNFKIGSLIYRKNFERYREDLTKRDKDESKLGPAPKFSVAPFMKNGEIFIPLKEFLSLLEVK